MNLLDAITIPDTAIWTNRYSWSPVKQSLEYSMEGSVLIQEKGKAKGRPITLKVSMVKTTLDALYAYLTNEANMTLVLGTESFIVRWDQSNPIESEPYIEFADPDDGDWYKVTLQFIQV